MLVFTWLLKKGESFLGAEADPGPKGLSGQAGQSSVEDALREPEGYAGVKEKKCPVE